MESLQKLWWEEEVAEKYKTLKMFSYLLMGIYIIYWVFSFIFSFDLSQFTITYFPYALAHTVLCILLYYIDRKGAKLKSIFSIVFSEYNCGIWWLMGMSEECKSAGLLFALLSFSFINICEWPFIPNPWIKDLVLLKHLLMWHYYGLFANKISLNSDCMHPLLTFLVLLVCGLRSRLVKTISYERFMSKKNLEIIEKNLSLIFNLFPDGILIISNDNTVIYSNANFARLLNCSIDGVLDKLSKVEYCQGKKYSHISDSNYLIDDISMIRNLQVNQEIVFGVSKLGLLNLEWRGQKVLWENNEAKLVTVRDANHLIELEQTISDNKLKNILLRSVSHELRTPINAISFISESLLEENDIKNNKKYSERLKIISVSSKLLISLINDLLDYSRILAGVFKIQKSNFLLINVITDVIKLVKIQAEKKGIEILMRIDPELPKYIYSDSLRISQIFLNLLSNALKFTLRGTIEVCCLSISYGKVKIIIKDTGIGIDDSKIHELFKEFATQCIPMLNPNGCGLGLHISNWIAKQLGGHEIEVESILNIGSSFSFIIDTLENTNVQFPNFELIPGCIPPSEGKANIIQKDFNKMICEKKRKKVLIVDDNDFNRYILGNLLISNGILFDEACTGREALELVEERCLKKIPYKLVIMDGSMPELNGWDAARAINNLKLSGIIEEIPIIIGYTAFSSEADIRLCIESGMRECLIKPCRSDVLIGKIFQYLKS